MISHGLSEPNIEAWHLAWLGMIKGLSASKLENKVGKLA
jgi:hypothetical protein